MDIDTLKNKLVAWAKENPFIRRLWICGSRSRDDYRPDSDLDIAIEIDGIKEEPYYSSFFHLHEKWEKDLNKQVPYKVHLLHYDTETPEDFSEEYGNVVKTVSNSSIFIYLRDDLIFMDRKLPKESLIKFLEENELIIEKKFRENPNSFIPERRHSDVNSYLNIYKYWNEYILKGKLPKYDWLVDGIFRNGDHGTIAVACNHFNIYQFYSVEFIDYLAGTIKKFNANKIIEIGAGDGLLSYFLNENEIDIHPTDDYSREEIQHYESVEKINHLEALKTYDPDLVLISWEKLLADYSIDCLEYPSVDHLIWIGENEDGCTVGDELWKYKYDISKNPHCLSRSEQMNFGDLERKTFVWIFYSN